MNGVDEVSEANGHRNGIRNSSDQEEWPEEKNPTCSIWSVVGSLTYMYMRPVMQKGYNQTRSNGSSLKQEDLFRVPRSMESKELSHKFLKYYEEDEGRLLRVMWRLIIPTFVPSMFYQLVAVAAQISMPLLVRELLKIIESNPSENIVKEGIIYALLLSFALFVNAIANQMQKHLATRSGIIIRTAVISAMYQRILELSPDSSSALTSGEVTNLVATDTQKILEVVQDGNFIWSLPLAIIIVTILLLSILGITSIVGILVLLLLIPMIRFIVSQMVKVRGVRAMHSDNRIEIISAMLQGIKVTKLNNYESRYQKKITGIREKEIQLLSKEVGLWALTLVCTVITPVIAAAATFMTHIFIDPTSILTASTVFSVLILFQTLRFPINLGSKLIGRIGQAYQATVRLNKFFSFELRTSTNFHTKSKRIEKSPALEIKNGTFSFTSKAFSDSPIGNYKFTLSNVNVTVSPNQILAILGPVGSGKSTLMKAIIGDVASSPDTFISVNGKASYASQVPFVLNATLRENILFGLPYDKARYEKVLDACCLKPDIIQFSAGDLTEIGERGVTLSGGQKQRVSLARVAYAKPTVAVFDDPLSALDTGTSRQIFERLFKSSDNDVLSSCAIVLVTHASYFLHRVDKIMVLVDGKVVFLGSWKELLLFQSDDPSTNTAIQSLKSSAQEDEAASNNPDLYNTGIESASNQTITSMKKSFEADPLITLEERKHGMSSMKIWLTWFKGAGGITFIVTQVIFMMADRLFYVATEWWLAVWSSAHDKPVVVFGREFPPQTDGRTAQMEYLQVYGVFLLISFIATVARSEWAVAGGVRCAKVLFANMLSNVLNAPMSFFETTPLGRLLNRFTFDVEVLDITATESIVISMISTSWFVAGICVMVAILPYIAFALVPVSILYNLIFRYFRKTGIDLQRLDAVSRSPVQIKFSEILDGATVIRVFNMEQNFITKFHDAVNNNSSAILNFMSLQSWLGLRVELLGATIVLCTSLLIVILNEKLAISPGLVGLLIIWSSNFTITLNYMVQAFAESEAAITSIERIISMSDIPQEKDMLTSPSKQLDPSWPHCGDLEFINVCARYRAELPLALDGLSFKIESGKRCGVVGRTGAGKSTLTTVIFRLIEIESGNIFLDGIDLSTIGLSDVRGRSNGMVIIPQDPFLASGSLRECVDPFGNYSEDQIMEALQAVRITSTEKGNFQMLNDIVQEGGSNYSVGERQLICLARSILAKPKLLVMDEATASVDAGTDIWIQEMLRNRFKGTTLLTIAHRLDTIMDYDCVLVIDKGMAVEFDEPIKLLEQGKGFFYDMVMATGNESANTLMNLAAEAKHRRDAASLDIQ